MNSNYNSYMNIIYIGDLVRGKKSTFIECKEMFLFTDQTMVPSVFVSLIAVVLLSVESR